MLKVKLRVSKNTMKELEKMLPDMGIEIDDEADLILYEKGICVEWLMGRDRRGDKKSVATRDIIYIESLGHDVMVHVHGNDEEYRIVERLNQLETVLEPEEFLRISNSVIVATKHIREIKPALFSKFTLMMSNGSEVDVTRSYYYIFKEKMGI